MPKIVEDTRYMDIDRLIESLQRAKSLSVLGGKTTVVLCEMDREYQMVVDCGIDTDAARPKDGATCLVSLHKLSARTSTVE